MRAHLLSLCLMLQVILKMKKSASAIDTTVLIFCSVSGLLTYWVAVDWLNPKFFVSMMSYIS